METIRNAGAHLMGSRTFYDMASWWPYSNEPFAAPMNEISKIVFSKKGLSKSGKELTTPALKDASASLQEKGMQQRPETSGETESWVNATVLTGDLATEINRLKQQPGKDLLAHGGAGFARSLIKLGLVDEFQLITHPVALGKGLPIFSELDKPLNLKLEESISFKKGTVANVYRPV